MKETPAYTGDCPLLREFEKSGDSAKENLSVATGTFTLKP